MSKSNFFMYINLQAIKMGKEISYQREMSDKTIEKQIRLLLKKVDDERKEVPPKV